MHGAEVKFSRISSTSFLWSFCVTPPDGGTVITMVESLSFIIHSVTLGHDRCSTGKHSAAGRSTRRVLGHCSSRHRRMGEM